MSEWKKWPEEKPENGGIYLGQNRSYGFFLCFYDWEQEAWLDVWPAQESRPCKPPFNWTEIPELDE